MVEAEGSRKIPMFTFKFPILSLSSFICIRLSDGKEGLLSVINVYCPRADPEREDRKTYKHRFYDLLQTRAEALLRGGRSVEENSKSQNKNLL